MADITRNPGNGENGYYLNVDDYYDKIHRTTWARRTAGMVAGATLGTIYGAAIGVVAAFLPYLLGVAGLAAAVGLPLLGEIGASVGLFALVAASIGVVATADVAAAAASSATGLEEKERREKIAGLNGNSPMQEPPPQEKPKEEKGPPLFSWKVAAITAPLFAAFGVLVALSGALPEVVKNLPIGQLTGAAAVGASATIFGMYGGLLALKNSYLTNKLTNFYYDVLTERLFKGKEAPMEMVQQPRPEMATADVAPALNEPQLAGKSFAANQTRFSLQELLEKTRERPAPDISLTR